MTKNTNKLFGKNTLRLFELVDNTPEWEQYVTPKTSKIIKLLKEHQSFKTLEDDYGIVYSTVRSHIMTANKRIANKDTEFVDHRKTDLSDQLFELMDNVSNWEEFVTPYEAELAKLFKKVKNFGQLSKIIYPDADPKKKMGNLAGTLYGTTQKLGVIGKIKAGIPQSERRNYSVLDNNQKIEDLNK